MAGIKESKELAKFVLELGEAVGKSLEDGKISFSDASKFLGAIQLAPSAFADISKLPGELKDLSQEEAEELVKYIEDEFDIPQDKVENAIEKALKAGLVIYDIIGIFKKKDA